jgi:uncharacterized protein
VSHSKHVSSTKPDLNETIARLNQRLPDFQQRYGVVELGVFGSVLYQRAENVNDIDVLVVFDDRPLSLFDFINLKLELSELLGTQVDLVEKKALKPGIADRVLHEVRYL